MPKKILVAYYTKTGSTKETAEFIGSVLEEQGLAADVLPFGAVAELSAYDGFVVGAPVNGMAWRPEAIEFVRAHQEALASRPTAFFLLSIGYGVGRESLKQVIPARFDGAAALVAPVARACFGGLMSAEPPLVLRLAFGIKKGAPRDGRDWNKVRAFAEGFALGLGGA
jgi:menaquinone-dependent protoporphyrinogen oxidase